MRTRNSYYVVLTLIFIATNCFKTSQLIAHHNHFHKAHVRPNSNQQSEKAKSSVNAPKKKVSLTGPRSDAFRPFSKTVSARVDADVLVVESNGMPDHDMMVGIRSWQQQVPLPQPFVGDNAWRLPMKPQFANQPISVLKKPLRGAIALAVNGVPIFCALNNRGEDTFLAGELDHWGGHCGRGDDYHYHIAPVHLEDAVGIGNPIGYALDGYPILGYTDADGSVPSDLDEFNGHKDAHGNYHYHATKSFPYVNGGLKGKVTLRGDQIEQPRDSPVRPGQSPLKGATVTEFKRNKDRFDVTYEVAGKSGHVKYKILDDEQVEFVYQQPSGSSSTVVYRRGRIGGGDFFVAYLLGSIVVFGLLATALIMRRNSKIRKEELK